MASNVNIDKKRLKELEEAEKKLRALERGGVDNWEFYDEAMTAYLDEKEFEDKIEDLIQDVASELLLGAYEPSERGAGYAVKQENLEAASNILKEFIRKIKNG